MINENLVIGCGLAGVTIARLIAEQLDEEVLIVDKREHIGGNCFDYRDANGIMIHKYGTHVFHTNNKEVWDFVNRFSKFNTYRHEVIALIDGAEVNIPFNFNSLYQVFPKTLATRLEEKLLANYEYNTKVPIINFLEQSDKELQFLGKYIYDKVFLNYTIKQWGTDPKSIDPGVTARVPVCLSKDNGYFQDKYQGMPQDGYSALIYKMLHHKNIKMLLNTDFKEINQDFKRTFCTASIDEFFDYKFGALPYRSVRFDLETHDTEFYQSHAQVNYPNNFDFTRIHEYKYFLNDSSPKTVIAKEYSEDFVLFSNDRYYPIQSEFNDALYHKYADMAKGLNNMYFLGRLGEYKYYNMDQVIAKAFSLFKEIQNEPA